MKQYVRWSLIGIAVVAVAGGGYLVFGPSRDPLAAARVSLAKGDVRSAQIELRNAVKSMPNSPEAHASLGTLQLRMGDPIAAERELKAAQTLGADPNTVVPNLARAYLAQKRFAELLTAFPAPPPGSPVAGPVLSLRAMAQLNLGQADAAKMSAAAAQAASPGDTEPMIVAARIALTQRDPAAALAKLDSALAVNPKLAEALQLKAQVLVSKNDEAGALSALDAALLETPNWPEARLQRAGLLLSKREDAKAKADVDAALKADPKNQNAIYLQGIILTRAGDYKGAQDAFLKIAAILPQYPRGNFYSAIVNYNLGQVEQAAESAERFVARNPADPDGLRLLAQINLSTKHPDRAIDLLSKAVEGGVRDPQVMDLLARAYRDTGRTAQAIDVYTKAAALNPGNTELLTRLASAKLATGDATGASSDLERSLKIAPDRADTEEALVVTALTAGDASKAAAALEQLERKTGRTESVGILRGLLKQMQSDMDGARAEFEAVLRANPDSTRGKINLARVAGLQGKPVEAEQLLNSVLTKEPANELALTGLVGLYLQQNKVTQATDVAAKAHAAAPGNVGLTAALADLYLRANEPAKAADVLDTAQAGKGSPPFLGLQARVQFAQGKSEDAKQTYRQVLAQNPADLNARRNLVNLLVASNANDEAKSVLQDGLQVQPGEPDLMRGSVALDFKTGGIEQALATAKRLRDNPANMPNAAVLRGDAYVQAGLLSDAANSYQAELKANPSPTLVLRTSGVLSAQGKAEEAAQVQRTWLAAHPNDPDISQNLAQFDIVAHRLDQAEAHLNTVLSQRPNDAVALNNLAWVYSQRGDVRALPTAQRSYSLAPTPQTADTLAWIMAQGGNPSAALPLLRQANAQLPQEASIAYHYASVLAKAGNTDQAAGVLRTLLAGTAKFDERADAQKLLDQVSTPK